MQVHPVFYILLLLLVAKDPFPSQVLSYTLAIARDHLDQEQ